jgi:ribosomal protein S18 acetylase RimI-like enzyme
MPSIQTYREYALMRGQIVEWNEFVSENDWANDHQFTQPLLDKCIAVYYFVNKQEKKITDRATVITYDAKYKEEFKELNLAWVKQFFEVEESDTKQLCSPEESILQPGGEIFFIIDSQGVVAGVVADVVHDGKCELAKMTVRKECTGKGYANILMREAIHWAKDKNFPFIELYSSVELENAIALYKKFGFQTTHLGQHPSYKRCSIIMKLDFDQ